MGLKVFISGPMTGLPNYNREAFMEAEKRLVAAGYSVWNPAWMQCDETWEKRDLISIDIVALGFCQAIYQLPGWENSEGAKVEDEFAKRNRKAFIILED